MFLAFLLLFGMFCTACQKDPPITSPDTSSATEESTEPETPVDPLLAYASGNDIVPASYQESAEHPVGEIILRGLSIREYTIIMPEQAGNAERAAAYTLRNYIKMATGFELTVEDDSQQAPHEISVGQTNRISDSVAQRCEPLGKEGYLLYQDEIRFYITGKEERGTYYGVISFLEDYIGCRFYTSDCERILPAEKIEIPNELDYYYIPKLSYRSTYYTFTYDNAEYCAKHKTNGYVCANLDGYGGGISYAGGAYVHTLARLAEMNVTSFGQQPCLSNSQVYDTVLKNVRSWLKSYGNASIISISQNDSYINQKGCQCSQCSALNQKYGSESGSLIVFINKIANEIRDEFPNVMIETLAYRYTLQPPVGLEVADNVLIRLCPIDCCQAHGLNDRCCDANKKFVEALEGWSKICKHLSIWDYTSSFANYLTVFPNIYTMYENIRYFASNHVVNIFGEGNYNSKSGTFEELCAYLYAKMLWNPDMTREEYDALIDDFLQGYYGTGWEYIRRFIDCTEERGNESHFTIFSNPKDILAFSHSSATDKTYYQNLRELFTKALALSDSEEHTTRMKKAEIQIFYYNCCISGRNPATTEMLYNQIKDADIQYLSEGKKLPNIRNFAIPVSRWGDITS